MLASVLTQAGSIFHPDSRIHESHNDASSRSRRPNLMLHKRRCLEMLINKHFQISDRLREAGGWERREIESDLL